MSATLFTFHKTQQVKYLDFSKLTKVQSSEKIVITFIKGIGFDI